ncbi:BTAD domain-containing putative transcriptional regulator [Actinoplanes sp. NEAU-A12]|uniref:BTAD domain-containing putative transcriptional regulator n=1 Tax=Actinoplanes sandaracinus TaxID=3045177 RepID=A0ABT6WK33_9ACTN|nr:BTAD domain-containing putative transcriptional regulator [Actinoplanes sandaracinus]MDI6100090.1 BTAD domain-containing putative transcriptional regulator [Actinoplanes sandaracinus]
MRFGILGPLRAHRPDGTPIPPGGPRQRALLAMLLLDAGRPAGIDRLIDGLYGDEPPAGAGNALQSQVSRLRQELPVELDPAGYRLAVPRDEVDAHRFADLAAAGRRALAAADPAGAIPPLREAVALWRGEPLADVRDAPFAHAHVSRLTELHLGAVEDLYEAEAATGAPVPHAVAGLRDLIAAHPLRERLRALLMRTLAAAGRPAEALAAYEDARRTLAEELGADPSPELAALHTTLLRRPAAIPAQFVPGPAQSMPDPVQSGAGPVRAARGPVRHGVPSQLTSFVGRDDELPRVAAALRTRRLVTLHGPGGAGKTRLAAEIAARHSGDVHFVELAAAGPDDVPRAVLVALGLRDVVLNSPAAPATAFAPPGVLDRLVTALAERRLLLVLDNCEHVVAAAADLAARLLAGAPGLRILATSREPLAITGEALCPVGGLPEAPAVQLFADRAADVVRGFAVTTENAAVVHRLCRTLDGLPLAVELAAARMHALPVTEIAARLDDRFRLLSHGSRTAESRHRTLRAVVAWSWDLLTEPERVLARRFTVFAGGATLDAVERICAFDTDEEVRGFGAFHTGETVPRAGASDTADRGGSVSDTASRGGGSRSVTVEVLAGLVGKSLIERDGDRYRMLETIRAYSAERLAESGERDRLWRAHAEHFLEFAARADARLRTADQLTWLDRLDAERDNLHAALRRTAEHTPSTALRLVSALSFYWWLRGLRVEAAALADLALRAVGPEPPPGHTEEYVLSVFNAALGTGAAGGAAARWAGYMRTLTSAPAQPFLLYLSAMAVGPPDDDPAGVVELNRKLREQIADDSWSRALGGIGSGWMLLFAGADPAQAEPEFRSALAGFRAIGDRWGAILALSGLAELAAWRGDPAASIPPTDEALRLAGELGAAVDVADLLRGRGQARMDTGDPDGAAADFTRAAEVAREAGAPELAAAGLLGLGSLALARGDLPESFRYCSAALAACPAGWYSADGTRMAILIVLGRIAELSGDPATAVTRYREVFTIRGGMIGFPGMAEAFDRLAGLAAATGDPVRAARLLGAVRALGLRADPEGSEPAARAAAAARATLGPRRFADALAAGAALSADEALALP